MSQTTKSKPAPQETKAAPKKESKDLTDQELQDATDALVADIDAVLEENAAQFVANYVQRGGE
jgi:ubiquitin-like protein Pup